MCTGSWFVVTAYSRELADDFVNWHSLYKDPHGFQIAITSADETNVVDQTICNIKTDIL